jgi:hypothetical protein
LEKKLMRWKRRISEFPDGGESVIELAVCSTLSERKGNTIEVTMMPREDAEKMLQSTG